MPQASHDGGKKVSVSLPRHTIEVDDKKKKPGKLERKVKAAVRKVFRAI